MHMMEKPFIAKTSWPNPLNSFSSDVFSCNKPIVSRTEKISSLILRNKTMAAAFSHVHKQKVYIF